jgi:hypothetical protein
MQNNPFHITQKDFAKIINISIRTFQRRLQEMNIRLGRSLLCPTVQAMLKEKFEEYAINRVLPKDKL